MVLSDVNFAWWVPHVKALRYPLIPSKDTDDQRILIKKEYFVL